VLLFLAGEYMLAGELRLFTLAAAMALAVSRPCIGGVLTEAPKSLSPVIAGPVDLPVELPVAAINWSANQESGRHGVRYGNSNYNDPVFHGQSLFLSPFSQEYSFAHCRTQAIPDLLVTFFPSAFAQTFHQCPKHPRKWFQECNFVNFCARNGNSPR
jgi:hypothetical protein